jgi:hypothetical protein
MCNVATHVPLFEVSFRIGLVTDRSLVPVCFARHELQRISRHELQLIARHGLQLYAKPVSKVKSLRLDDFSITLPLETALRVRFRRKSLLTANTFACKFELKESVFCVVHIEIELQSCMIE